MLSLANKQILLGITGGIAAYKSAELCRLLIKAGAEVRVVMTPAACEFITPLTMQALSGNRVHTELLDEEAEAAMGHIELARWADLILVTPASANFIARLAHGEANDLLSTICLATTAPIALAPAMNQAMWKNQNTQNNLAALETHEAKNFHILGPADGEQACGESGPGRMLEPSQLLEQTAELFQTGALAGLSVCITAGPTREAIDPVRYISNHSSGKMGYALASAAAEAGAKVTLISGPVNLFPPPHVEIVNVESAEQMLQAATEKSCDIFIGVAAVADYRPQQSASNKIKKTEDNLQLELVKNPDILASIAAQKAKPFCVGFAAETENLKANALAKLKNKNIDLVIANHATETFNSDEASVNAYWHNGEKTFAQERKEIVARKLILLIKELI